VFLATIPPLLLLLSQESFLIFQFQSDPLQILLFLHLPLFLVLHHQRQLMCQIRILQNLQ
jgi:hypothetical protein